MGIGKNERIWMTYSENGMPLYLISSRPDRTLYYLYKMTNGQWEKIQRAKSPSDLEESIV